MRREAGILGGESGVQPLGHFVEGGDGIILERPILEADVSMEGAFSNGLENVWIVNFAVLQLVPARISGCVKVADLVDIGGDVLDEMPLADLLMIDVEDYFDVGVVDFIDNLEGLVAAHEVIPGMIDEFVEWLDDESDAGLFEQRGGFTQAVDE